MSDLPPPHILGKLLQTGAEALLGLGRLLGRAVFGRGASGSGGGDGIVTPATRTIPPPGTPTTTATGAARGDGSGEGGGTGDTSSGLRPAGGTPGDATTTALDDTEAIKDYLAALHAVPGGMFGFANKENIEEAINQVRETSTLPVGSITADDLKLPFNQWETKPELVEAFKAKLKEILTPYAPTAATTAPSTVTLSTTPDATTPTTPATIDWSRLPPPPKPRAAAAARESAVGDSDRIGSAATSNTEAKPKVKDETNYDYRGHKSMMGQVWSAFLDTFKAWPMQFVYFMALRPVVLVDSEVRGAFNYLAGFVYYPFSKNGADLRQRGRELSGTLPFLAECVVPLLARQTLGRTIHMLSFGYFLKGNDQKIADLEKQATKHFRNSIICKTQNLFGDIVAESAESVELRTASIFNNLMRWKFGAAGADFVHMFYTPQRLQSAENGPGIINKLFSIFDPSQWPGTSFLMCATRISDGEMYALEGGKTDENGNRINPREFGWMSTWFGDNMKKASEDFLPYWIAKAHHRGDLKNSPGTGDWFTPKIDSVGGFALRNAMKFGKWIGDIVRHHTSGGKSPLPGMPKWRTGDPTTITASSVVPATSTATAALVHDDTDRSTSVRARATSAPTPPEPPPPPSPAARSAEASSIEYSLRRLSAASGGGGELPPSKSTWNFSIFSVFRAIGHGLFGAAAKSTATVGFEGPTSTTPDVPPPPPPPPPPPSPTGGVGMTVSGLSSESGGGKPGA